MAVSVVMAVYNGEKYLKEQLDSIVSQLSFEDELIVSLDPSLDRSKEIILQYKNIKLVEGPGLGVIKNFENGLKYATNDFVFLADQDDVWMKDKVKKVVDSFETDTMIVMHDAIVVDENKNELEPSFFEKRNVRLGIKENLLKNSYIGCCMCLRKEVIEKALPFPDKLPMHDQYLGLVGELIGKNKLYKEPLILYRRHSENVSCQTHSNVLQMLKWRFEILKAFKFVKLRVNKTKNRVKNR